MSANVAAPAGPSDESAEEVLNRAICRCGRLAAVVVDAVDGEIVCTVRCACQTFSPASADEGVRP